jgi:hypothetical protein
MIIWDFSVITALTMILALGVVLGVWISYTFSKDPVGPLAGGEFFRQCGFCSYLYLDYLKKNIGRCPRCGSYVSPIQKA